MKRISLLIAIMILTSLACNMSGGESKGGEVRVDEQGFSVEVPKGYEMSSLFNGLDLTKKGADPYEGPAFSISVTTETNYEDLDDRLDFYLTPDVNLLHYTYSNTHIPVTFGSNSGMSMDFTGKTEEKGVDISGREVVANLSDGRYLYFSGYWPADKQDSYLQAFTDLLNSIKFFEPITPSPKP